MITENELKILGFEHNVLDNNSDEYYYSYVIVNGLSLITNTDIESEKSGWVVEIFNVDPGIMFSNFGEVQAFINSMERKIVKK
jgi:hypothetical protein